MLVLSRKQGEEIVIGNDVHITVVSVQGNRVKLGITAPREIVVRRAELDERTVFPSVPLTETHDNLQQLGLTAAGP